MFCMCMWFYARRRPGVLWKTFGRRAGSRYFVRTITLFLRGWMTSDSPLCKVQCIRTITLPRPNLSPLFKINYMEHYFKTVKWIDVKLKLKIDGDNDEGHILLLFCDALVSLWWWPYIGKMRLNKLVRVNKERHSQHNHFC